jgi:hypothetical protein
MLTRMQGLYSRPPATSSRTHADERAGPGNRRRSFSSGAVDTPQPVFNMLQVQGALPSNKPVAARLFGQLTPTNQTPDRSPPPKSPPPSPRERPPVPKTLPPPPNKSPTSSAPPSVRTLPPPPPSLFAPTSDRPTPVPSSPTGSPDSPDSLSPSESPRFEVGGAPAPSSHLQAPQCTSVRASSPCSDGESSNPSDSRNQREPRGFTRARVSAAPSGASLSLSSSLYRVFSFVPQARPVRADLRGFLSSEFPTSVWTCPLLAPRCPSAPPIANPPTPPLKLPAVLPLPHRPPFTPLLPSRPRAASPRLL